MVPHFAISSTCCSSPCLCVGYVALAESDIVFNLFHGLENLINLLYLFFRLLEFCVTTRWRWGWGTVCCFSVWLCSSVLSFIKIMTIRKKTLCDLEVHLLTANTLGGVGARNRQCLGQSVSEQPLSWGRTDWWISVYSHQVTGLDLKKTNPKTSKNPSVKYLISLTCLAHGVRSPHCAHKCGLQITLCAWSSVNPQGLCPRRVKL